MFAAIIEPFAVPDVFANGVASVEDIGDGMARVELYATQRDAYTSESQRVLVARLVMPRATLHTLTTTALAMSDRADLLAYASPASGARN